jgi:hypothetical protein
MNIAPEIQSIGPAPQLHADRVVAGMMRLVAQRHADLPERLRKIVDGANDGAPAGQRRLTARIKQIDGVHHAILKPGKRGKYKIQIFDVSGWDSARDAMIGVGDVCPERPWLALWMTNIISSGNGRGHIVFDGYVMVFVTHHALSRAAQRFGVRTVADMLGVVDAIHAATIMLVSEKKSGWCSTPPEGWPIPIGRPPNTAVVVVKSHETRQCLIATTVYYDRKHQCSK